MFLGQVHFGKLFVKLCFLKRYCVVTLLYMTIYKKCIIFGIAYGEMHEYVSWKRQASLNSFDNGFHGFMVLFEILKMLFLNLYYLRNWCKAFLTRNGFEDFENIVDIWLLNYFMKLLESKLCILNTFNLWAFDVDLPLYYDIGDFPVFVTCDYSVFVTMSLWCVINPSLCRQARSEAPTLHDTGKSLSVWVRLLPIKPKDQM